MANAKPELRAECVRLRVEEHLSLKEISARTGAAQGSLSVWLSGYPLPPAVRAAKSQAARIRSGATQARKRAERLADVWHPSWLTCPDALSPAAKARISEAAVLFRMALLGWVPLAPVFDSERVDWYVELPDHHIVRIQVKWVKQRGRVVRTVRSNGVPYVAKDMDFLVGYDFDTDSCYIWTFHELQGSVCRAPSPEAREAWHKIYAGVAQR